MGGILFRNCDRTFGFPRGANDGLELGDSKSWSRLEMPYESSSPVPRASY